MTFIMLQHSIGGVFSVMPGVAIFLFLSGFGNNESFLKKSHWGGNICSRLQYRIG